MSIFYTTLAPSRLRLAIFALVLSAHSNLFAQTPGGSNIWVGQLVEQGDMLLIENLRQVTDNEAYTNQPYFTADNHLLYTQSINKYAETASSQMDIFKLNLSTAKSTNLTNSAASEYSATVMPNGRDISVIRVDNKGKQALYQLDPAGKPIKNLFPNIEPVGYHVWTGEHTVLMFVLGEPHELVHADTRVSNTKGTVVDTQPGPSLYQVPNTDFYSYTKALTIDGKTAWQLHLKYSPIDENSIPSITLPSNGYYYAWSHKGHLLSSRNGKLVSADLTKTKRRFVAISGACSSEVSRIAVNEQGMIALVCAN